MTNTRGHTHKHTHTAIILIIMWKQLSERIGFSLFFLPFLTHLAAHVFWAQKTISNRNRFPFDYVIENCISPVQWSNTAAHYQSLITWGTVCGRGVCRLKLHQLQAACGCRSLVCMKMTSLVNYGKNSDKSCHPSVLLHRDFDKSFSMAPSPKLFTTVVSLMWFCPALTRCTVLIVDDMITTK